MGSVIGKLTAKLRHVAGTGKSEPVPRGVDGQGLPSANLDAWPEWLSSAIGPDALVGLTPRRADSFKMLEKVGSGTYSNVYKARDLATGRLVALKKVRAGSCGRIRLVSREVTLLRRLDHPNVIRLEGIASSRIPSSPAVYLVFEYMEHDLAGLVAASAANFTESEIKCYMKQLLSGLEHCHSRGVLHRDIKGANVLLNNNGIVKIADFGLSTPFIDDDDDEHHSSSLHHHPRRPMTSRVVSLWYRPPELLLGATHYGVAVDLWSAGCILAELLTAGKPLLPGRTEVEQLHKIFKLCGSPSEEYLKMLGLSHVIVTNFGPYKGCISETFADLPPSSVSLITKLLSLDPDARGTATSALNHEFFTTEPYPCEISSLPHYSPSKVMEGKWIGDKLVMTRQLRVNLEEEDVTTADISLLGDSSFREDGDFRDNGSRIMNDQNRRKLTANAKSTSERFPPRLHLEAEIGFSMELLSSSKDVAESSSSPSNSSSTVGPDGARTSSTSLASVGSSYHSRRNALRMKKKKNTSTDHIHHHSMASSSSSSSSSSSFGVLIGAFRPHLTTGHSTSFRRTARDPVKAMRR